MFTILALPLVFLLLVLAIRAHIVASEADERIRKLGARLQFLEDEVKRLRGFAGSPASSDVPLTTMPAAAKTSPPAVTPPSSASTVPPRAPSAPTPSTPIAVRQPRPRTNLESEIGSRWMLLAGVVVLVLGMAFFVKYAFDRHWINETARVGLGTVAGLALWGTGLRFSRRGYLLFGQMVAGGGLATMFVSAWAAAALYGLVSIEVGFVWIVAVSALAALTADRQRSAGLALLAVAFAYLAPFLVRTGADRHLVLFIYEGAVALAALALVQRHGWPVLGVASWWATWTTLGVWLAQSYRDAMFASTEAYLVFVSSVFVAMLWMYRRRTAAPAAKIAAHLLSLGPALFHAASLYVLFNHSLSFLTYLILGTALLVSLAKDRSAVRLLGWLAIAAPFVAWIGRHAAAGWYVPALVTATAIYTQHLWWQLQRLRAADALDTSELVLFHFNALGLFLFDYLVVEAHAGSTSMLAAAMTAWQLFLAWRFRSGFPAAVPHALATAFTLAAVTIALTLTGPWITVAYAAEGAAVIAVGLFSALVFFRYAGILVLAFAVWRLVLLEFNRTPAVFTPLFNSRTLTGTFIVTLMYAVAWLYRRHRERLGAEARQAMTAMIVAANVLTVGLVTADIDSFWLARPNQLTADFSRQLSISGAWAAYAMGAIWIGFRRRSLLLRYIALGLFGVTLAKMFTVDLLQLDGVYRISGFIALGLVLLTASFLYQRQRPREQS